MSDVKIQVNAKGPLLIKGGASGKKPFCDGAHRNCTTL